MLKCTRCRHVFPAPASKTQAPASSVPKKSSAPAEANLTLPFDEPSWNDEPAPASSHDLTISEADEQYTLGAEEQADELVLPADAALAPAATSASARRQPPRLDPPQAHTPPTHTLAAEPPEAEDDELDGDTDDVDAGEPVPRRRANRGAASRAKAVRGSERGRVWALMIFLAAVLASYGMLMRALLTSPQLCDHLLSRVPLLGLSGDERLLTRKIALSDVNGGYQRIKDGKQVFVISGKALNTAPVALHGVQIAGKLFDDGGHELDQKIIFCGNVISTKVLKDLTPREVSILQKLSPPKRFSIEPGQSSTFVIVFMEPPREAVEFRTQVAAAQRQA